MISCNFSRPGQLIAHLPDYLWELNVCSLTLTYQFYNLYIRVELTKQLLNVFKVCSIYISFKLQGVCKNATKLFEKFSLKLDYGNERRYS